MTTADSPAPAPKPPRPRGRRFLASLLRVLTLTYIAWCAILFFGQERLLFASSMTHAIGGGNLPPGSERLWLDADSSTHVEAWLLKPRKAPVGRLPLVIFFHGNAETIDDSIGHADLYTERGYAVLLPEYRGYGRSGGSPSEAAIGADMVRFHDLVAARDDIDPARIIYHGRSLGGGVACDLARARPPQALVLESAFTSIAGMCWSYGVPPILCRNPFHNDEVLRTLDAPMLIMHGSEDNLVPVSSGRALHALARRSRYLEMPGHHNDFPSDWRRYEREIDDFLRSLPPPVGS